MGTYHDSVRSILEAEVTRFRSWAEVYPAAERYGEWECDYDEWMPLYEAFARFVAAIPCTEWDRPTVDLLVYIIARDWDIGQLVYYVEQDPENLLCLAGWVRTFSEDDARWQLAAALGRTPLPAARVDPLLIDYARDENEYVRRRALLALGERRSPAVEDLVDAAWDTNEEYQRMATLEALYTSGSTRLQEFLARAANDNRPYLTQCATRIQHRE